MPTSSSTDELLTRLQPLLDVVLHAGRDVAEEVGNELTEKTAGGITSLALRSGGAVYRAIKNRYLKSRAKGTLDKALANASSRSDREAAYREFLDSDPTLRDSLAALLERREYLWALQAFCEDLPISDLVPGDYRLSEVFVPPSLVSAKRGVESRSIGPNELKARIIGAGNSVILGDAGSGKSSLARWLASSLVDDLLRDENAMSLDELRLPVYVTASNLQQTNWATALRYAIDQQLGIRGLSELSGSFFDIHSPLGHRKWIVLIDGFDEVRDESKRNSLFQAVSDVAKQDPDAFRFIAFARGSLREPPLRDFDHWNLLPERNIGILVDRYLEANQEKEKLKALLSEADYAEIARAPFFVAMSAALISAEGEIPERPFELVEAFLAYGVETSVPGEPSKQQAIVQFLTESALSPDVRIDQLSKRNPDLASELSGSSARLQSRRTIAELMQNTGLVAFSKDGSLQFIHKIIQQHLIAKAFAAKVEPTSAVWSEIDPGGLGWASVEQLCIGWIEREIHAAPAIEALADYGPAGLEVMLRLSIQLVDIPDAVFERAFQSVFEEIEDGITTSTDQLLSRLASTRTRVRQKLRSFVNNSWHGFHMEPAARALAESGHYQDIRSRLVGFVNEKDGDPHSQCQIASILHANGDTGVALQVFLRESEEAADDWMRLDAICRYYRASPTPKAKRLLRDLINRDYVEGNAKPTTWLIEEMIELGETELALPLLREAASFPNTRQSYAFSLQFSSSVRAATALAKYDPGNGVAALELLLCTPELSLREKAEVIASINEFDPERAEEADLAELTKRSPHQLDWYVIETLTMLGKVDKAWSAVTELADAQLQHGELTYSATQCLERVLPHVAKKEADSYLNQKFRRFPSPKLATMFSIIGRSNLTRDYLHTFLTDIDPEVRIDAARLLSTCGARTEGQAWLTNAARDSELDALHRISAAQTLSKVASSKVAMVALRKLVRNSRLNMEARCKAAEVFAQISNGDDYRVVSLLVACCENSSSSIEDRIRALLSALRIDPEAYEFDEDPDSLFIGIIEDNSVEASDLNAICKTARKLRFPLSELGRATELLKAQDVAPNIKLSALLSSSEDDPLARTILAEIAKRNDVTISEIESIVSHFFAGEVPPSILARAEKIIADPASPPRWRLRLAKCIKKSLPREQDYRAIPVVYEDTEIDISIRLEALSANGLADHGAHLSDLTQVREMTVVERLAIGNAALEKDLSQIAIAALEEALEISPKSTFELVSVFQLAEKLGHPSATAVLDEIVSIPLIVMIYEQDSDSVLHAIDIGGQKDNEWAINRLSDLVVSETVSLWRIPELIDRLAAFAGKEEALETVRPVLGRILIDLLEDPVGHHSFPTALEKFYERGWLTDAAPLFEFARDPNRRFSQRVSTAVLLQKTNIASDENVSQLVSSLLKADITSTDDALIACGEMTRTALRSEALFLADRVRAVPNLTARQLLSLANVYSDLGHGFKASQALSKVALAELKNEWIFDWDKAQLRELFGEREVTEFLRTEHERPEDFIERLYIARDLVNEFGDHDALALIHATANDEGLKGEDRLEAIDLLDELGYRKLARDLFSKIELETCDPLFAGAQSLRLGYKAQALGLLRKSVESESNNNRDWLRSNLAELMASKELKQLSDI